MLVTFCVYIFGMILIGFIAWRSTKNFDDYILGGRSLGPFVTALSAGASDMSGWLLMGLPGAVFFRVSSWIAIGLTLGAWINWKLVAGRLRVHTEYNNNALTLRIISPGALKIKAAFCALSPRWLFCCSSPFIALRALWQARVCLKVPLARATDGSVGGGCGDDPLHLYWRFPRGELD